MGKKNKYVLAMYDIRGKQDFIYKTNKIKEIVGGSWIIRDCFDDYLFPAAKKVTGKHEEHKNEFSKGIITYKKCKNADYDPTKFSVKKFEEHLKNGYIGEVVYDGGGNFFVIYDSVESYREVNKIFYKDLYEKIGTLKVLTSYIQGVDFDDYSADQERIYSLHGINERKECAIYPVNALPVVQVDYRTSMPLVKTIKLPVTDDKGQTVMKPEKVTLESYAKYKKYDKNSDEKENDARINDVKILDEMIDGKGIDSHLAVIYIDGNSMGAKVQTCLENQKTYEQCVEKLRSFSNDIEENYINLNYSRSNKTDSVH